jgi:hypothetical protein
MSTYGSRTYNPPLGALALGVVACLVAVAVWFGVRAGDDQPTGDSSIGNQSSSEHVVPASAPKGGVVLPEGADQVDGYPVKFPYTDLGAVAVQVAIARGQTGFDYDQAATIAGVYAAPDDRAVFEARSTEAVELRRKQAGVSASGEVPAPTSYALTPVGFTVEELDADYFAVSLLSYVTMTAADNTTKDFLYTGAQLLRWIDGDWKIVPGSSEDHQRLLDQGLPQAAAPGTPEYEKAGWITLSGVQQ